MRQNVKEKLVNTAFAVGFLTLGVATVNLGGYFMVRENLKQDVKYYGRQAAVDYTVPLIEGSLSKEPKALRIFTYGSMKAVKEFKGE